VDMGPKTNWPTDRRSQKKLQLPQVVPVLRVPEAPVLVMQFHGPYYGMFWRLLPGLLLQVWNFPARDWTVRRPAETCAKTSASNVGWLSRVWVATLSGVRYATLCEGGMLKVANCVRA
jgi:hypothetical protein